MVRCDVVAERVLEALDGHDASVWAIASSSGGSATAAPDGRVLLRDGAGRVVDRLDLRPIGDSARSLAFGPGGRSLVVGTLRGQILRYEVLAP